ncbi:hypothetical protein [Flavobacterium sp.]|uniref:hypothetical protein n=1 Tax=Flavobacterium sp. TaxID=239 RepID=UPI0039E255BA
MKKYLSYFVFLAFLCNCKSYRNEFKDYEGDSFDHVKKKFLNFYNAEESKYSVLEFGNGFSGEKYTIINNREIIYDSILNTNPNYGHAKYIRINNLYDTKITDNSTGKKIIVKRNFAQKYKYIYVNRKREYLISSGLVSDSIKMGEK